MLLGRRRTEEGQVYPALLLAVIGGFALAVGFLGLQNLLDQTGRAASASDSAALAVGRAHRDNVVNVFAGDPGLHLGQLASFLENAGPAPGADQVADQYARANGGQLEGTVQYEGFDLATREWTYQVSTLQRDKVEGGTRSAQSESTSRVAVTITGGLCPGLSGIEVDGECKGPADFAKDCVAPEVPTPSPTPTPGDDPTKGPKPPKSPEPPTPTPDPFHAQGYCGLGLGQLLQWKIHLVNQ